MRDLFTKTKAEFHRQQSSLLQVELAMCWRNADLASRMYHAGNHTVAERTIADAESSYATVVQLMSDPARAKRLTIKATQEFTEKLHALRGRLNDLKRLRN